MLYFYLVTLFQWWGLLGVVAGMFVVPLSVAFPFIYWAVEGTAPIAYLTWWGAGLAGMALMSFGSREASTPARPGRHARRWVRVLLMLAVLAAVVCVVFVGYGLYTLGVVGEDVRRSYLKTLDERVAEARDPEGATFKSEEAVRPWMDSVNQTCGKLILLNASNKERLQLNTTQRSIFQDRVNACIELVHYRIDPAAYDERLNPRPEPTLRDPSKRKMFCADSLLVLLCDHWGLP